jgi:hypothetical protein
MRQICRSRVEGAIARYLDDAEAREIELRLKRSAAYLSKYDRAWWERSRGEKMRAAAAHAKEAAAAEVDDRLRAFDLEFQLRQAGRAAIGKDFDRLEASGSLRFENRPEDLDPALAGDKTISAVVTPDEGVVIFRERVTPELMKRVLMHEQGAHVGLPAMMGKKGYNKILDSLSKMSQRGDKDLTSAKARVPADTPPAHYHDELLAYLVEDDSPLPLVKQALGQVKAWAIRAFPDLAPLLADAATLRALAAMAIRYSARRRGGYALSERLFIRGADETAGTDDSAARAAFEARLLHADPEFDPARMDEAWAMHQRYKAAKPRRGDLLSSVPGENGPTRAPAEELRRMDRMVERFRGCVL